MSEVRPLDKREQRLETWVRQYGTAILRTCFVCLSDVREAEDAMQETFLKAWRAMDRFEGRNGAGEKTWLTHIAINVCRDMQRSRWFRHVDLSRALEDIPQTVASVLPEDRTLLMDIMRLPEKYRQPVLLYYYQDMTLEETAEVLGASKSTIHHRLRKAEQLLRLSLEGGDCYV
ncbi:MAG: sigma-70 family RNA polymerase sigma factor [Aristaeellaceae bacterium]